LTRSSSAGPEDRAELNPDIMGVRTTSSARASPMPFGNAEFTTAPSMAVGFKADADNLVQQGKSTTVQWSQQSSAIAKTDFASSTKALGTGLARRSPAPPAFPPPMQQQQQQMVVPGGAVKMEGFAQSSSSSSSSTISKQQFGGGSSSQQQSSVQFSSMKQTSSSFSSSSTSSFQAGGTTTGQQKVKKISFKQ